MSNRITIKEALEIWEQEKTKDCVKTDICPSSSLIQRVVDGQDVSNRDLWMRHLADCSECRTRWIDMMKQDAGMEPYFDIADVKVADQGKRLDDILEIPTMSGKCLLTLRRNLEKPEIGFLLLSVVDGSTDLEGRELEIWDEKQRSLPEGVYLYKGVLKQGKLKGWIKGYDEIELPLTVRETGDE